MASDPKLHTHTKLSYLATRCITACIKHTSHTTHHIVQIICCIKTSFKHMYVELYIV